MRHALLAATALLAAAPAFAETPQPLPFPSAMPTPQDVKYPGVIKLNVDATDTDRHIFTVHETVPVQKPGDFILLYPAWIPGDHSPTGPISDFATLVITSGGTTVPWIRDVVDMNAFHVNVPEGTTSLDISFQYLSPPSNGGFRSREEISPDMFDLGWHEVVLYPAGVFSRGITVEPRITLPKGWQFGTALETAEASGSDVTFKQTTLNTLIDSPIYAGRYFSRLDLAPGAAVPVHLDIVADRPQDLDITADQLAKHRALVQQAVKLYGAQHYKHYDFLLSLSDQLGGMGVEHHQSSEDGTERNYFSDWDGSVYDRDLLPHEYTHSWNGKFRRPADLWSPNFDVPERDSLLWVYEGQTQFWGQILAARSGLWSHQDALDAIALDAAEMQAETGRVWRPLQDTTNDPIINQRRPQAWRSWERSEDYYTEGLLIWLDADSLIRETTHGQKSMNDFARAFFGVDDGQVTTVTYQFDDVVKTLNDIMPYDWAKFLRSRLDDTSDSPPLDGITRGGYKLVFTDKPSGFLKSVEGRRKGHDYSWSVGFSLGEGGTVSSVIWGAPAFRAGLVRGSKLVAVNGLSFEDSSDLEDAIKLAKTDKKPIELLVQDDRHFRTLQVDYHGGLRYPHLERVKDKPALLDDLLAALK